jgi:hypothetical protein
MISRSLLDDHTVSSNIGCLHDGHGLLTSAGNAITKWGQSTLIQFSNWYCCIVSYLDVMSVKMAW